MHRVAAPTDLRVSDSDDDAPSKPSKPSKRDSTSKTAAAPTNLTHPSSSDDDTPLMARKKAAASKATAAPQATEWDEDPYLSSGSNSSIPAVTPKKTANAAKEASSARKRDAPREHTESPTKRVKVIWMKKGKSPDKETMLSAPKIASEAAAPSNLVAFSKETTPVTSTAPSQQPTINQEAEVTSSTTTAQEATTLHPVVPFNIADLQQINGILSHLRENVDATWKSVQGAEESQAMKDKIASLETPLAAALDAQSGRRDLVKCKEDLAASLAREKELSASFESLKVEHQKQVAFNNELRRDIEDVSDEMNKHSDFPYEKVTDDKIEDDWLQLAHEIQNFSLQVLTKDPARSAAPKGANFAQVGELRSKRRNDPDLASFYFQKHIWDRINDEVFCAGSNVWGGRPGKAFNRLCIDLMENNVDELEKHSRMKAQTAEMLHSHDATNKAEVTKLIHGLKQDLHIFTNPEVVKSVESRLKIIVHQAIRLNIIFLKSKAFFRPMDVQNDYEDADVDIRYTRGNRAEVTEMELQVSPQITKIGDADGHNFSSRSIVCKAIVTMCEPKLRGGKRGRE
ncbi:hypothetical protein ACHAPT_003676 [Fusarium lateritium]